MNPTRWTPWTKTSGTSPRRRYRPGLDFLEDRTVPTVFVMDGTLSCLTLSGDILGGDFQIQEQGPGSLTTCYDGVISADVNLKALTLDITFDTLAIAQVSGNWKPGAPATKNCEETAPANYGGQVDLLGRAYASFRDLYVTTYGSLALQDAGGGAYLFDSLQALDVAYGIASACHPSLGFGETDISGLSGEVGAADLGGLYDLGGGTLALFLNYNMTFRFNLGSIPVRINVVGAFVAVSEGGGSPAPGPGGDAIFALLLAAEPTSATVTPAPLAQAATPQAPAVAPFTPDVREGLAVGERATAVAPLHVIESAILDLAVDWATW